MAKNKKNGLAERRIEA